MEQLPLSPLVKSVQLAGLTTLILAVVGLPTAYLLSKWRSRVRVVMEAVITLPLVLPPSVLGFYLLILFNWIREWSGIGLAFTFSGLVVASVLYSLPFMIQPLQTGFDNLDRRIVEASYVAGKGAVETFFRVVLPNIKPHLITAMVLTFAHTMGEFGVVLMVGGNRPDIMVASIAVYQFVEEGDYTSAHIYSGILVAINLIGLTILYLYRQRVGGRWRW
jgi:molybdate transport system permease protein